MKTPSWPAASRLRRSVECVQIEAERPEIPADQVKAVAVERIAFATSSDSRYPDSIEQPIDPLTNSGCATRIR